MLLNMLKEKQIIYCKKMMQEMNYLSSIYDDINYWFNICMDTIQDLRYG